MSTNRTRPGISARRIADKQWGALDRAQLLSAGMSGSAVSRWCKSGILDRLYPGVYAFGHEAGTVECRISAALLYAGHAAALSNWSAAFWWRFTDREPTTIDVAVPSHRCGRQGIRFHRRTVIERVYLRRLPVLSVPATLIGFGAQASHAELRRALAEADRLGHLDPDALRSELRRGRAGSAAVRKALDALLPELADTLSELEERFLDLVIGAGLPLPLVNATVCGLMVDALFERARLIVELDGHRFHRGAVSREIDRDRELRLRAAGYRVVRYTWRQVVHERGSVIADLRRQLRAG